MTIHRKSLTVRPYFLAAFFPTSNHYHNHVIDTKKCRNGTCPTILISCFESRRIPALFSVNIHFSVKQTQICNLARPFHKFWILYYFLHRDLPTVPPPMSLRYHTCTSPLPLQRADGFPDINKIVWR